MKRAFAAVAALLLCACLTGCAHSRSEITLRPTAPSVQGSAGTGKIVVIRSVVDERVFEQAPEDPSIPSLSGEGAAHASIATKASAIGRKRDAFKSRGDVLLDDKATVVGVIRENLAVALAQAGYQVKDANAAGPDPLVVDAHIRNFWAWMRFGFWSHTLNANIATDLLISNRQAPVTIEVHAEESRQLVIDSAWREIIEKALIDFRVQATSKLADEARSIGAAQ